MCYHTFIFLKNKKGLQISQQKPCRDQKEVTHFSSTKRKELTSQNFISSENTLQEWRWNKRHSQMKGSWICWKKTCSKRTAEVLLTKGKSPQQKATRNIKSEEIGQSTSESFLCPISLPLPYLSQVLTYVNLISLLNCFLST